MSIVLVYYLPDIKTNNTALLSLWREGVFLAVMIAFTVFFMTAVERKRLKVFNLKNKLRHYSIGLLSGVLPLGLTVSALLLFKMLKFSGANKVSHIIMWLSAILFNAIANELLLRGYLFRLYRKYYSLTAVTVVITLLFISLNIYIFSDGIIYAANMLLTNIMFCLIAEYSYSVLAPVTAHFFYNAVSSFLLGSFSLSEEYPVLLKTAFSGNKYLSGGDMKLEGSVILLAANIALCAFFIVKLRKRKIRRAYL